MKNQFSLNIKTPNNVNFNSVSKRSKKINFLSGLSFALLSLFAFNTVQAQETKTTEGNSKTEATKQETNIIVKGTVVDENGLPAPAINIVLQGTSIGLQTDFDGNFTFPEKLKKGDVLVFSSMGMASQKIVIDDENSASKIELKVDMEMSPGKVSAKGVYKSRRK